MLLLWLTYRNPGILQAQRVPSLFLGFTCRFWQMWHQKRDVCQSSHSPLACLEGEQVEGCMRLIGCIQTVIISDIPIAFFYTSGLLISQARPLISVLQTALIFTLWVYIASFLYAPRIMTFSSLEEVKMIGFSEVEELNSRAGLERRQAGRLAEAQRSPLGPLKGTTCGLQRMAARWIQAPFWSRSKRLASKTNVQWSENRCVCLLAPVETELAFFLFKLPHISVNGSTGGYWRSKWSSINHAQVFLTRSCWTLWGNFSKAKVRDFTKQACLCTKNTK